MKITKYNCGKFGGVRIAFRRTKILKKSISFNLLFGGGALFNAGEDVMFIRDCIKQKLNVIAVPDYILNLREERKSTWFKGYDRKFFSDMGASYVNQFGKFAYLMACIQLKRKKKIWLGTISEKDARIYVKEGIKNFNEL